MKKNKIINIITNKKAHKKICGILTSDSKNIPAINDIQRKNSILDEVIDEAINFLQVLVHLCRRHKGGYQQPEKSLLPSVIYFYIP
ncbi:MAG: hypothetical protein A2358_01220 [Candidatus Staskawiczbacteria bacterium RIFOXYB1_FULL_37_44]|uniref:Uncharacterized protein n=1 Tax=Candidatus Staskawiczbacteria bacterium RIFOXYB1_FULL_37_44 TaxID=1802223 RepID=A0A1G2IXK4_9BACT|nr:MAG: hypothetical protein A2358_01220 [Candidatus Staskawiczbacteria bacterium RIFOXYB1_FULL_37_44]OGZ83326.1 MAG: hypothetical protein A2416_01955 [Candidatus Staskawiczbacteria bacterium RIFOXYC1_FULL_37_52]OGZ88578.1 MAG: hypothetical protein A2444_01635 [Candidatus Staskawiczbacteria bacterium RIFOXYC2_FULL_37_19]